MGVFRFDPQDLITGPFEECPFCGGAQFGVLAVHERQYVQRCRGCMQSRSTPLPAIVKRVIYLDQHAISHMAKALHPESTHLYGTDDPRTQYGFWREAFRALDTLHKLQVVVCPESRIQRQESLLDDRLTDVLRSMYEHLAGGVRFADPGQIFDSQLVEHFEAWLDRREPPVPTRSAALNGRVDAWLDRLRLSVRMNMDDIEAAEARQLKARYDQSMQATFDTWQRGPSRSYEDFFEANLTDLTQSPLSWTHRAILRAVLERRDISPSEHEQLTADFERSEAARQLPTSRLRAAVLAALGVEAASGRAGRPTPGMLFDIQGIGSFLPYCDAMFVDRQCHRLLTASPAADELPSGARVFSIDQRDEFLQWLSELDAEVPPAHRDLVLKVYGETWLEPFEALYTWDKRGRRDKS